MWTLAALLHRIDPYAVRLWADVGVRWYGLSYLAGFALAFLIIRAFAARGRAQLPPQRVGDFVLTVAIGTVIGGRLGYCVFYQPSLLVSWRMLALWDGGMASHGGIVGIIVAAIVFARRNRISALHLLDLTILGGCLGVFFGRLANFVNGELYGRECPPDLPWAVRFPQELEYHLHHPQVMAIAGQVRDLIAAGVVRPAGDMYHSILNAVQTHDAVAAMVRDLPLAVLPARHPSQIYQALLEGLALFAILVVLWYRPRKPGVIAGWFLVGYAGMRIIGEQFRMPDAHLGFQALGLTRGQWLSLVMLAVGLVCLIYWSRRNIERLSGWGPKGIRCEQRDPSPSRPGAQKG